MERQSFTFDFEYFFQWWQERHENLKGILHLQWQRGDIWGDISKEGKTSQLIVIHGAEMKIQHDISIIFKKKKKNCRKFY